MNPDNISPNKINPNKINPKKINPFADAYERALLPLRRSDGGAQPELGALDVAVGAGWYRLVCAVEALVDGLGGVIQRLRAPALPRADARPGAQPIGGR